MPPDETLPERGICGASREHAACLRIRRLGPRASAIGKQKGETSKPATHRIYGIDMAFYGALVTNDYAKTTVHRAGRLGVSHAARAVRNHGGISRRGSNPFLWPAR